MNQVLSEAPGQAPNPNLQAPTTSPQAAEALLESSSIPISNEQFADLTRLYRWQNRHGKIVKIGGIDPETDEPASYALMPYYGEEWPHYSLHPTSYDGEKVRFYGLGIRDNTSLQPLKSGAHAPDFFSPSNRKALESILPNLRAEAIAIETIQNQKDKQSRAKRILGKFFRKSLSE